MSRNPSGAYDVIVVGARCAGAPTAMLLARRGYRVLLVDHAAIPSDTMRNHLIQAPGIARLQEWGLLERLKATGCPPIREITVDFGDFPLTTGLDPADGMDALYAPRRYVLDGLLAEAAVATGVELRDRFSARELIFDDEGAVCGIRGQVAGGSIVTERARIVIGADGLHSLVARSVQSPAYNTHPALTFGYYSYFANVPFPGAAIAITERRFLIAFPTHNGLTCVAVQAPIDGFAAFRADLEGSFYRTLGLAPWIATHVGPSQRVERWRGTADLPNFLRKPFGPGWALVGDAGYHKDPLTAQGISDAFRDAGLLAAAIDTGLGGTQPLAGALGTYERQRNTAARRSYAEAIRMASFPAFPEELYRQRAAQRPAA